MFKFILLVAACGALTACASVPNVDHLLGHAHAKAPEMVGARGPLTPQQSKAVLQRAGATGAELPALERHLAIEQEVAETPLLTGNRTQFLRDGDATFRAMFTAIRDARETVNFEYYIFEDIESDGVLLSDLLVQKAKQGVAVNIIYDSYGSGATPDEVFNTLKDAGITLLSFNPVSPFKARGAWKPFSRDHRKSLIVDGRLGIIGGINLSKTYLSSGLRNLGKSGAGGGGETGKDHPQKVDHWRDTDLQVEGPVVARLQKLFLEHWSVQHGPPLNEGDFFPKLDPAGDEVMRIIGSAPKHEVPRYYVTLLSAIRNADKNVYMTAAYFVPTRDERQDLADAARRGVDVRLLLPAKSDSGIALAVQHSRYGPLFAAGVKIYEATEYILHSKMVSVDGVWTAIGSSNLDPRSVIYNDEIDGVVLGSKTAAEMERLFNEDIGHARAVDPETWRHRGFGARIKEFFAKIIENFF